MKTIPLGEIFEYEDEELMPVKCGGCFQCRFNHMTSCTPIRHIIGSCATSERSDRHSVIFIKPDAYALLRLKGEL